MLSLLPSYPLFIPIATAILALVVRNRPRTQWAVALMGTLAFTVVSAVFVWRTVHQDTIFVGAMGGWPAPFGIVLVIDVLAAIMLLVTGFLVTGALLFVWASTNPTIRHPFFHPLLQILVLGVAGAYMTGDLFDLYVWFEVLLITSFVLLGLGQAKDQLEGAFKYVVLNLFASVMFLTATGIIYGATGTLSMAELHMVMQELPLGLRISVGLLLFVAFGIKAAIFPLFFWLPASYHTAPPAVGAIFSGLLTKVGVVAIIRLNTLLVPDLITETGPLIGIVAAFTMVGGVLGAFSQYGIRRILSFHIISQIGFLILAVAIGTPLAYAGLVFYMIHNILAKADLFLVGGIVQRRAGGDDLAGLGGLWRTAPMLGLLFLVPALALAGLPPLSGFWAKLLVLKPTFDTGAYLLGAAAIVTGLLTLLSMLKIWNEAFWKESPHGSTPGAAPGEWVQIAVVVGFAAVIIGIGLFPTSLFGIAEVAASQLSDPQQYVDAVLGGVR